MTLPTIATLLFAFPIGTFSLADSSSGLGCTVLSLTNDVELVSLGRDLLPVRENQLAIAFDIVHAAF
jgi:hypothetical protein